MTSIIGPIQRLRFDEAGISRKTKNDNGGSLREREAYFMSGILVPHDVKVYRIWRIRVPVSFTQSRKAVKSAKKGELDYRDKAGFSSSYIGRSRKEDARNMQSL